MSFLRDLFTLEDTFNRVKLHNINFVATQSIRLLMLTASFAFWIMLVYVWVKAVFSQILFYTLTLWLVASCSVALASGREVVEVKMLEKLK